MRAAEAATREATNAAARAAEAKAAVEAAQRAVEVAERAHESAKIRVKGEAESALAVRAAEVAQERSGVEMETSHGRIHRIQSRRWLLPRSKRPCSRHRRSTPCTTSDTY